MRGGCFLAVFIVHSLFGSTYLEKYEGIPKTEADELLRRANRSSAKKTLAVFTPIAAVLMIGLVVLGNVPKHSFVRGEVFYDVESFQEYMATEGKRWAEERWGIPLSTVPVYDAEGNSVEAIDPDHDNAGFYDVETLFDGYGNAVCEYVAYFNFLKQMEFSGNDLFPMTVYTAEHYESAGNLQEILMALCGILLIADIIVGCLFYTYSVKKNQKKAFA